MLNKIKRRLIYLTTAFTLANFSELRADGLDNLIDEISISERKGLKLDYRF